MVGQDFEKSGNMTWAQCPNCEHWFHVSPSLMALDNVNLICPECGISFPSEDAKSVLET